MSETLSDLAIETIRNILTDLRASPSVRLKAALAILKSETMSAKPVAPKPEPAAEAEAEPEVEPDPLPGYNPETGIYTPMQQVQTIRREAPKTGRNDACPCGSGLKFKRCCLNKPATRRAAA